MLLAFGGWLSAQTWLTVIDDAQRAELARPVAGFAQIVLAAAHARVLKRGRRFSRLAPPELHRLRIAAKKLRYAADFLRRCLMNGARGTMVRYRRGCRTDWAPTMMRRP